LQVVVVTITRLIKWNCLRSCCFHHAHAVCTDARESQSEIVYSQATNTYEQVVCFPSPPTRSSHVAGSCDVTYYVMANQNRKEKTLLLSDNREKTC
jgi:hypothetical protein